ncbi:MAG: alpha/beta hydrolase family protein [Chitinispirillaceae bacterium]
MESQFKFAEWENGNETLRGSLHLCDGGNSPWVIFSHGFTGHRLGPGYFFVKQSRALAEMGVSSLRYDFRGSGESDGNFQNQTFPTMCSDLLSATNLIRTNFRPSSLFLFGHSLGGLVSAEQVSHINARGLILLSAVADLSKRVRHVDAIKEKGPDQEGLYEYGPHKMSLQFLEGLKGIDPKASINGFSGDVLAFHGDRDETVHIDESRMYMNWCEQRNRGDFTLVTVEGGDHNYTSVQHVDTVITTVCSWLKERLS